MLTAIFFIYYSILYLNCL